MGGPYCTWKLKSQLRVSAHHLYREHYSDWSKALSWKIFLLQPSQQMKNRTAFENNDLHQLPNQFHPRSHINDANPRFPPWFKWCFNKWIQGIASKIDFWLCQPFILAEKPHPFRISALFLSRSPKLPSNEKAFRNHLRVTPGWIWDKITISGGRLSKFVNVYVIKL